MGKIDLDIRKKLETDFKSPKPNLVKKVLSDRIIDQKEYHDLKSHYSEGDKKKELEFDVAFKSFAEVNLGVSKQAEFGAKSISFPKTPTPQVGPDRRVKSKKVESTQKTERLPQVVKPDEAFLSDGRKHLENRQFWPFIKNMKEAPSQLQGQLMKSFQREVSSMDVNDEKSYLFSKNVLTSAKSMIGSASKFLEAKVESYEIFTGRTSNQTSVVDKNTKRNYLEVIRTNTKGNQTDLLSASGSNMAELMFFLADASAPSIGSQQGNALEKLVNSERGNRPSIVQELSERLASHPGENLSPEEVLSEALKSADGDLPLANLAAHNLLKNIAYFGRPSSHYPKNTPSNLYDKLDVVKKLGSMRPQNSKSTDKMGPWYHFFGIQTAAAATNSSRVAKTLTDTEHLSRQGLIKNVRQAMNTVGLPVSPSPSDKEKSSIDKLSLDIAGFLYK